MHINGGIYNSRNYSRLPNCQNGVQIGQSTIVEIIQGYPTQRDTDLANLSTIVEIIQGYPTFGAVLTTNISTIVEIIQGYPT